MTYEEYWEKRWPLIDRRRDVAWEYLRGEKFRAYLGLYPSPNPAGKKWEAYCSRAKAWVATKEDVERGVAAFYGHDQTEDE